MRNVQEVFWRAVTKADFYNVERGSDSGPESGGGQLYFSVSFGDDMDHEDLGRFLGVDPPEAIRDERPAASINVGAVENEAEPPTELQFRARYRPPQPGDRYYIARQNRRRESSMRPAAWMPEAGFPSCPETISGPDDPLVPDLSLLKIYVVKCDDGSYFAGFVNATGLPKGLPSVLNPLFTPNAEAPPNGLIKLGDDQLGLEAWRDALARTKDGAVSGLPTTPEVEDASDFTRRAAGARPRGQGFRQSAEERRAIELRAMDVATAMLIEEGWKVDDVSTTRSYDLHCERGEDILHVEVKGTTGDGASVLLTPNEVELARDRHPDTALVIVSGITISKSGEKATAQGGELSEIRPWQPDDAGSLHPIGFHYVLAGED